MAASSTVGSGEGVYNDAGFRDKGFTRQDQKDMQRLGKPQELMRNFRPLSALSLTAMIQATWEFLLLSSYEGLVAGGLAGMFWSYCFSLAGFGFVMLCLAEMASISPTSGGQYHWVSEFAPIEYQRLFSYLTGWMSIVGWLAGSASGTLLTGTLIQALVKVNSPSYEPQPWRGTLLVFAMVAMCYAANIWGAKRVPLLQNFFLLIHIFGFFAVVIVIWVMCPRNTPGVVFTQFYSTSGWSPVALSVIVGQSSSIYGLTCFDATAHMAEEIKDASHNVPRVMTYAYLLNGSIGLVLLIAFLVGVTDIDAALADSSGFPFIWVLKHGFGVAGVNGLTVVILMLATASNVVFNATTSRQIFAFARDKGLPFSSWLGRVERQSHVPANSILFTSVISCLLSLINIASSVAFDAIVSLQISALMFTYIVSISCMLWRRVRLPSTLPAHTWELGRYGVAINTVAVLYAIFAFSFCFWPNTKGDDAGSFNWALVLFLSILLAASGIYWSKKSHLEYRGPVLQMQDPRRDRMQ